MYMKTVAMISSRPSRDRSESPGTPSRYTTALLSYRWTMKAAFNIGSFVGSPRGLVKLRANSIVYVSPAR